MLLTLINILYCKITKKRKERFSSESIQQKVMEIEAYLIKTSLYFL